MAKMMLEGGLTRTLGEEDFIGTLYKYIMDKDAKLLERHAHSMKGRAK